MKPEELRKATRAFDEEMVVDKSRPLTAAERRPGRRHAGSRVGLDGAPARSHSVSVERGLLARSDAWPRNWGSVGPR